MKKKILALFLAIVIAISTVIPVSATFQSTTVPNGGSGTLEDPYYFDTYPQNGQVTWKAVVDLRYPYLDGERFGAERSTPLVKRSDVYEYPATDGNGVAQDKGKLLYSWLFDGNKIPTGLTPAVNSPSLPQYSQTKHPYDMGIDLIEDTTCSANLPADLNKDACLFLKMKNNFEFCVKGVSLIVHLDSVAPGKYENGQKFTLYSYSTASSPCHASPPYNISVPWMPGVVQTGLTVENNTVKFDLTHGGNYVLIPEAKALPDGYTGIATADEFLAIANDSTKWGTDAKYIMTADLDFTGKTFIPIGNATTSFLGMFDGNGHTMSNITYSGMKCIGVFANLSGATIKNLTVSNSSFTASAKDTGAIAGITANGTTIDNCHTATSVTVNGRTDTGGIVGCCGTSCVISNCTNAAAVVISTSNSYLGGIVGKIDGGSVKDCTNTGSVTGASASPVGGISGGYLSATGSITSCINTGSVTGTGTTGGIAGSNDGGQISGCSNSGLITGSADNVGGIAGNVFSGSIKGCTNSAAVTDTSTGKYVGGIVGNSAVGSNAIIEDCTNSGNISGAQTHVGGIVGMGLTTTVTKCSNAGSVTAPSSYIGGIVGFLSVATGQGVSGSYNTGNVTGESSVGGIVGGADSIGVLTGCYNTGTITGAQKAGGIGGSLSSSTNTNPQLSNLFNLGNIVATSATLDVTNIGGIAGFLGRDTDTGPHITNAYTVGTVTASATGAGKTVSNIGIAVGKSTYSASSNILGLQTESINAGLTLVGLIDATTYTNSKAAGVAEMVATATYAGWPSDVWTIEANSFPWLTALTKPAMTIPTYETPDQIVTKQIAALPSPITLADKTAVEAARAAFNALTDAQQALVTNLSVLTAAEKKINELQNAAADQAAAQQVIDKIAALPSNITLADKAAVEAARAAYDDLQSSVRKALVTNYAILTAAEDRIAQLSAPVTSAPVTSAPVTSAPVTSAPVTSAPVTSAPVTSAPVTSAPVTLAPVTSAPVTLAPVTSAPVTSAPVTSAPVTSAPVASAPKLISAANSKAVVDLTGATLPSGITVSGLAVKDAVQAGTTQSGFMAAFVAGNADKSLTNAFVYDIVLLDQYDQPITGFSGSAIVKLPIPEGMDRSKLKVYYYNAQTGELSDMGATIEGDYLVFTTTHFSYYAVAEVADTTSADSGRNPKTGVASVPYAMMLVGISAFTVGGLTVKKRPRRFRMKK